MSNSVRFAKVCPTCGRTLHIPVDLLGREVCCQGCGAELKATISDGMTTSGETEGIDARVERLIQAADKQLQHFSAVNI